jgi:hypothetical protein
MNFNITFRKEAKLVWNNYQTVTGLPNKNGEKQTEQLKTKKHKIEETKNLER